MIDYRAQIMKSYPKDSLTQCAIVLDGGTLHSRDDPEIDFKLGLRTVYLRDADPEELLKWPGLSILAELARGDHETRLASALAAVGQIRTLPEAEQRGLFQALLDLGSIHFDATVLSLIIEEIWMSVKEAADIYRPTSVGQELLAQGMEKGMEKGIELTMAYWLQTHFGPDARISEIASGLAHRSDHLATVAAIAQAESLDELVPLIGT